LDRFNRRKRVLAEVPGIDAKLCVILLYKRQSNHTGVKPFQQRFQFRAIEGAQ